MAAIVTLTEARKAKLVKCLNNLNLGFVFSGFGEAFAAMIEGAPLTLDEAKKAELKHLINNLNLGTFHAKAGDLLVDLMDHGTSNATAKAMTEAQKTQLAALFHNLNMGLAEVEVGDLIVAAVEDLGHATAAPKLVWDGAQPTKGVIGTPLQFKWKGGTPEYNVVSQEPNGKEHDNLRTSTLTYDMNSASEPAGDWTVTVTDAAGAQLTQKVTMAAAPKVLKTIKLTGKEIALTGDAAAGYVIDGLKVDASNQDEITVAVATDVGAAMPADAAIKVEIADGTAHPTDLAKLEAISVSAGKFIIKAKATGGPADGDSIVLKVTAGTAAEVTLTAKFIA